jgi:NAD-reducing hydrogenase large subunit
MTQRIVIDPVTRIEGHAKITIHLEDDGRVRDARFHVAEFRGFERFCVGRPFWEMAGLSARICGICPVSHLMASAKAGDGLLAVTVPPAAVKLRRLMNLAQIIQSHALSFFHLSGPDLLLGFESDPERRNVFGLIAAEPELARGGIRLRQFGQEVIEALGGKKIHPAWAVPGGVRAPLDPDRRRALAGWLPEVRATTRAALDRSRRLLDLYGEEAAAFGDFPSLFLGLVGPSGEWEHYDGRLRFVDADGATVFEVSPARFAEVIGEHVEDDSYLKSPYFRPLGYPAGLYRVGPLARLNVCTRTGAPLTDAELAEFRQRAGGKPATSSFLYHHARLIEVLAAAEKIEELLADPDLESEDVRARAGLNRSEAVGCSEAPRGTLFHHYRVDDHGLLTHVNLLIATGQNNLAMNRTIAQIARHYLRGRQLSEGVLNRVEAGIRAFDPCLSCSTHAFGQMPLHVLLIGPSGELLDEARR